ncbi:MAG: Vms1/Ankzf1 family peptidyl-tRNA hydrolase [Halobacteriales archaeon]
MVSLDSLLGRERLKRRIRELESEVESLESRLESADERRAQAETEKQEAYEQRNRLENKVEELRDRLERAEETEDDDVVADVTEIPAREVDEVVDLLSSVGGEAERLTTAYVEPGGSLPDGLPERVYAALSNVDPPSGMAVYLDYHGVTDVCLLPLRRVNQTKVEHGRSFDVDTTLFSMPRSYAVAVVRADSFAAGVYREGSRVDFGSHDTDVKSDHSKGGFSQKRFERLRDEQIKHHVDASADTLEDLVAEYEVEALYLLGAADLTGELAERVDVDVEMETSTDARGRGEDLLDEAVYGLRSSRLYRL